MKAKTLKKRLFKGIMLFFTLFVGIGAVVGSVSMLLAPDGSILHMQALLPYFKVLPFSNILFQNFIFPGISLLIVNGISNLLAAAFIIREKKLGAYLGCIFGFTLMLWITIQFVIFPTNILSILYFIFGALQFICGILYIIFFEQSQFTFDESLYKNIGKNKDTLVVFFSRSGYTKRFAYEKADKLGADIYEVTTSERTAGFLGFAWLGRFGMHKWALPINDITVDAAKYQKVIIVTPIYVFSVASPIRAFLQKEKGKLKNVEYITLHFRKSNFSGAFDEMDSILSLHAKKRTSDVCRFGKVLTEKSL